MLSTDGDLRLIGGSSTAGRLEIYHNNEWGTICNDGFDRNDIAATVACRQLGFTSGSYESASSYGHIYVSSVQIWLADVMCSGSESFLTQCAQSDWGIHNCFHWDVVAVTCAVASGNGGDGKNNIVRLYPKRTSIYGIQR